MSLTSGPWVAFAADADGPHDVLPAGRPGCIARDIQSADDARMIALAPLMLKALKHVRGKGATMEVLSDIESVIRTVEGR